MKLKIILYLSIIFSFFCFQFDYLVTLAMEKFYGEIFYTNLFCKSLEGNILVLQTRNLSFLLLPFIILSLIYIIYRVTLYLTKKPDKTVVNIIDCTFIGYYLLLGVCHLLGGLSWFLSGRF